MKAVIFDLGNVLVGYDHQATLAALAARTSVDAAAVQDAFAVVGAAAGSDLVTTFLPANASITTVVVDPDGSIAVEALGSEAPPVIS